MSSEGPQRRSPERRFELLDKLREGELRAASSRVAAVIGHIIGTPLNVIAGRAAMIRENPEPQSAVENALRIEQQVEALTQRVHRLIAHLNAPEPEIDAQPVRRVLDDAVDLYQPIAERRGVEMAVVNSSDAKVCIDATAALIVLSALLSIASKLPDPGSQITVEASSFRGRGIAFEITVPGMTPPSVRIDSLDPPESEKGNGAAQLQVLSVCSVIAARNGGRLQVLQQGGSGATMRFECPQL